MIHITAINLFSLKELIKIFEKNTNKSLLLFHAKK